MRQMERIRRPSIVRFMNTNRCVRMFAPVVRVLLSVPLPLLIIIIPHPASRSLGPVYVKFFVPAYASLSLYARCEKLPLSSVLPSALYWTCAVRPRLVLNVSAGKHRREEGYHFSALVLSTS